MGDEGPFPAKNDVLSCQCSKWYPIFSNLPRAEREQHVQKQVTEEEESVARLKEKKRRSNVTLKSIIIRPLPAEFEEYLLSDGIYLPKGATNLSSCCINQTSSPLGNTNDAGDENDSDAWSSDSDAERGLDNSRHGDSSDDNSDRDQLPPRVFDLSQVTLQIKQAIQDLGGSVLPKLNWSAPKDSTWMLGTSTTSLKCQTPGDIYLLIKSSDFCLHDAVHALDDAQARIETNGHDEHEMRDYELELVLKQWVSLWYPSMEFRCFIHGNSLLAISQRNHTQYFSHLISDMHDWIAPLLVEFWESTVRDIIQHPPLQLSDYVLDVYMDSKRRVWIVDFNPWSSKTDALLWTWPELKQLSSEHPLDADDDTCCFESDPNPNPNKDKTRIQNLPPFPEIRIVETPRQIRPDPLASYRAPVDTLYLAEFTSSPAAVSHGGDAKALKDFLSSCKAPTGTGPSSLIRE
jgi:hypothetical protein